MNKYLLGKRIREYREARDIKQFGLELEIGASPGTISRIENGVINPTKETLLKIIDALELNSYEAISLFEIDFEDVSKDVSNAVAGIIDIDTILTKVVSELGNNLGYKYPAIFLYDEERKSIVTKKVKITKAFEKLIYFFFKKNISDIYFPLTEENNILVKALLHNELHFTNDLIDFVTPYLNKTEARIMQKALETKLMIAVPIAINDKVLGVLGASFKYSSISEQQQNLLKTFANQVAIAIYNSKLFSNMEEQVQYLQKENEKLKKMLMKT